MQATYIHAGGRGGFVEAPCRTVLDAGINSQKLVLMTIQVVQYCTRTQPGREGAISERTTHQAPRIKDQTSRIKHQASHARQTGTSVVSDNARAPSFGLAAAGGLWSEGGECYQQDLPYYTGARSSM